MSVAGSAVHQQDLPHKDPPSLCYRARSPAQRELPPERASPALYRTAPRSGSSPRKSLLPPSIEQPRAAGAPPERASSLHLSSSPAQRELCQKEPSPSALYRAAPCSGISPRESLLPTSIEQPRAAGELPEKAQSLPITGSSPAQRELSQKESPPYTTSNGQPRAAGASLERASSFPLLSSPVQRELLGQRDSPPYLNRVAMRSGSSPRNSLRQWHSHFITITSASLLIFSRRILEQH